MTTPVDYALGLARKYAPAVGCEPGELLGLAWQACTSPGTLGWRAARYRMINLLRRDPLLGSGPRAKKRVHCVSLSGTIAGPDGPTTPGDMLPDKRALDPAEVAERRELADRALTAMTLRERVAAWLYYGDGLLLREAGQVMGVTESRVNQLAHHGCARARHMLEAAP